MMFRPARLILLLLVSTASADALHDHDNGPFSGIFGLPDSTEGGALVPAGSQSWGFVMLMSSHSVVEAGQGESLVLDGETTRIELAWRRGLSSRVEIGFELPYVWHDPGGLDSIVDAWHAVFGLPEGPRASRPKDMLEFRYRDPQGIRFDLADGASGVGDARLFAGWQIGGSRRFQTALRFGVKLPTGNSSELLGSGGTDLSLGIAGDGRPLWGSDKLSGFYRLSAVHLGEPDLLAERYNAFIGHAAFGLGYAVIPGFELRLQGAFRSPLYDSAIDNLGKPSAALLLGGNFALTDRLLLSLAVGEDLVVKTAPDVSFQLAIRYRPN